MSDTNRHRKPTPDQLASRTYRQMLKLQHDFEEAFRIMHLTSGLVDQIWQEIDVMKEHLHVLTGHCVRLVKEKEVLMDIIGRREEARLRANEFMAEPVCGYCFRTHAVSYQCLAKRNVESRSR